MRRFPVTSEDICRWKNQGLGQGSGADYKPWIDVRCFSSSGKMHRRPGVTTRRVHHLLSSNESNFCLMADYAWKTTDLREQFPLFPEKSTQEIAKTLNIKHPLYPKSSTPLVMTTDFLLTVVHLSGKPSFEAWSVKSADELRGRKRKSTLEKLEIERRYWLLRGVPWYLVTDLDFNHTLIDNLDWLNYLTVEDDIDPAVFAANVPPFLAAFSAASTKKLVLRSQLQICASALGNVREDVVTQLFRYCTWHRLIHLDLSVPVGLRYIPCVLSIQNLKAERTYQGNVVEYAHAQ